MLWGQRDAKKRPLSLSLELYKQQASRLPTPVISNGFLKGKYAFVLKVSE